MRACWSRRKPPSWPACACVVAESADDHDEIAVLEQGADDYIAFPMSARRLRARILALVRRSDGGQRGADDQTGNVCPPLSVGGWQYDVLARKLFKGERSVSLTEVLGALLQEFFHRPGRVVSRDQLLRQIQALGSHATVDGVDTYVHRLRQRLLADAVDDFAIDTARGQGYVLRCVTAGDADVPRGVSNG
jgi:DNA-binding response OmpR family regulator